ncbi:MAG: hypothetical protein P4L90_25940 [Rhodopila sp.]|nr:hypothetical protein [Rhodopila sp.]
MKSPAEALAFLATVRPGDPLVGTRINPSVSSAHARLMDAATGLGGSIKAVFAVPTLDEMADHMGVPVEIQDTVSERDLMQARAVLTAAIRGDRYVSWNYEGRSQGNPVRPETVRAAIEFAESVMPAMAHAAE